METLDDISQEKENSDTVEATTAETEDTKQPNVSGKKAIAYLAAFTVLLPAAVHHFDWSVKGNSIDNETPGRTITRYSRSSGLFSGQHLMTTENEHGKSRSYRVFEETIIFPFFESRNVWYDSDGDGIVEGGFNGTELVMRGDSGKASKLFIGRGDYLLEQNRIRSSKSTSRVSQHQNARYNHRGQR